jgi:hypothetical protein
MNANDIYSYINPRNVLILAEKQFMYYPENNCLVIKFEVMITRDQYLFLMLGIYEDFDDDLLFDAIDLLTPQN